MEGLKKKIEKMTIEEFNECLDSDLYKISVRKARLIPTPCNNKTGRKTDPELVITGVFLKSLILISEFRDFIFKEIEEKILKSANFYVYTEVQFPMLKLQNDELSDNKKYNNLRLDGLLLITKGSNESIYRAIAFEMKSGNNVIDCNQIQNYKKLTKKVGISKIVTVSNQFTSSPKLTPHGQKNTRELEFYHLSWGLILNKAKLLFNDNDYNIEDEDQKKLMSEVIDFFEHDNSRVKARFNEMALGWKTTIKDINDVGLKSYNNSKEKEKVESLIDSWYQEEKDIALYLGLITSSIVQTKSLKKDKTNRNNEAIENLRKTADKQSKQVGNFFESEFIIDGCVSNLVTRASISTKEIEYSIELKDDNILTKDKISNLKINLDKCLANNTDKFLELTKDLVLNFKKSKSSTSFNCSLSDNQIITSSLIKENKNNIIINYEWKNSLIKVLEEKFNGGNIKTIKLVYTCAIGVRDFMSPKKFVEHYEKNLIKFYDFIVRNLVQFKIKPPKVDNSNEVELNN